MSNIQKNEELINRYPFLRIKNVWTGKPAYDDGQNKYTYLDDFPDGWRKAFGLQFCDDFLEAFNHLSDEDKESFYFTQIKEKFGGIRIYCVFHTEEMIEIIHKYEKISYRICINCGAPAKYITKGWVMPLCENCVSKKTINSCWTVEEFFKENDDEQK